MGMGINIATKQAADSRKQSFNKGFDPGEP
jgi:hypothetical protein